MARRRFYEYETEFVRDLAENLSRLDPEDAERIIAGTRMMVRVLAARRGISLVENEPRLSRPHRSLGDNVIQLRRCDSPRADSQEE